MSSRLLNVRLTGEDQQIARELRARGVSISDVVRRALRAEAEQRAVAPVDVIHLNRDHRHPDIEPLFVRTDVTEEVEALVPAVIRELAAQRAMLDGACPEVAIGPHCDKRYPCPFRVAGLLQARHRVAHAGVRGSAEVGALRERSSRRATRSHASPRTPT